MEQIAWTTRIFNFEFPAGLFPVIISRLRGAYPRIKQITSYCDNYKLKATPNGGWSIQQHIGHLIDLEDLHHSRLSDYKNNSPVLSAWDGSNKKTNEADHNAKNINELLLDFNKVRDNFIQDISLFSDDELLRTAMHPRLQKPMRIVDLAFFVAEHDDHHIAKMESMI